MKQILRACLVIAIGTFYSLSWGSTSTNTSFAMGSNNLMLAANVANTNSANSNPLMPASNGEAAPTRSTVDPNVAKQTQNIFQSTQQNLNLYVTQLQCQSQGINTNTCNSQNNTTNNSPTMLNSVNKFLFNSVTSSLGVGVEVNF